MTTFTQPSKNSTTFAQPERADFIDWDDPVATWADAFFSWDEGFTSFAQPSKNTTSFTSPTKN